MPTVRDLVKDRKVYSVDAGQTVLEAARFMMEHNIGALPVIRNGELAGIFSERDPVHRGRERTEGVGLAARHSYAASRRTGAAKPAGRVVELGFGLRPSGFGL